MPPRNRELRVVISGDPSQLSRAFAKAGASAQQFEGRIGKTSSAIGHNLAVGVKVGTAAIGVGLVGALKGSIDAFAEAQRVGAQTNAVLKSTGGAANLSTKQVSDLATAISKKSGMDDEAIQSGENLLLTFTKIRDEQGKGNDIFTQATSIMADMSTALGQDTKSSAIQLGKALNDPVKGVTALQRVGVSFTKSQKDQISTLVDSGKTMDAQKLILKELNTEFGGSARAAGDTFAGKINKAKVSLGNLGEAIGGAVAPALGDAADKLADFVDKLASSDRPARFFGGIKDFANDAKDAVGDLFHTFDALKSTRGSAGAAIGQMLQDAFTNIDWSAIGTQISTGLSGALNFSSNVSGEVEQGLQAAFSNVDGRKVLGGLLDTIGEALDALFSPSFWIEHFSAIFSLVTFVIPVGKILRIPGFATLYRFISAPIFRAAGAVGTGLLNLLTRGGSRAFTGFLAEIEKAFPRVANAMLRITTGGAGALRSFPGRVAQWASRTVGSLVDRLGDAVGRVAGVMGRAVGGGVARLGEGVASFARAAGRIVVGILRRFDALAGGVPSGIAKALAAGTARMAGWVANFANAAVKLGTSLVSGIVRGVKSSIGKVAGAITGGLGSVASKLNPFGDGIGRQIGKQQSGGLGASSIPGGGAVGSLMGARPGMAPIAAIGARFGLRTSSGGRPGSITSSGNVSFHSTGEALDEAGAPANMMRFYRYMRSNFGARLAELIYTPGRIGIKNGQATPVPGPIYDQKIAADHYDHVHVALDLGHPGVGDGVGRQLARKPGTGDGTGNLERIASFLRGRGFTPAQTAGILGNLRQESGFNPGAIQQGGPGRGLAQWGGPRFAALQAFARRQRKPWTDLTTQLQFMMSEFRGPEGRAFSALRGAHTVGAAETAFGRLYERYGVMGNRSGGQYLALARSVGRGGGSSASGGSGGGGSTATPDTTNPYELAIAGSDVDVALAQQGGIVRGAGGRVVSTPELRETAAQNARMRIVNARINKIRQALRRHLRPATRLRLRQEYAQLLGERSTITGRITELGAPGDTATDTGTTGLDTGTGDAGGGDPNQALIDSQNALAEAVAEAARVQAEAYAAHQQELAENRAEMKRQTDFATSATATSSAQAWKALADALSGQIIGRGLAGRTMTAGRGVEFAY